MPNELSLPDCEKENMQKKTPKKPETKQKTNKNLRNKTQIEEQNPAHQHHLIFQTN